jgi:PPP family 3-phenylpropionic acid transporter
VVWFFPREAGPVRSGFRRDVVQLLQSRPLLTFYGAATLVSLSSGPFGVYFSIHLRELGHSAWLIGLAWTAGVASEIGFLVYARRLQGWMGVKGMIALGMAASALRWEMVTWTESGALLVAIQVLHGLTFGVYHAGAIQYVDRLSGPATKNTAQSLYGAATFGAGSTAGALLAGWLLPAWGFIALLHAGALLALAGVAWFALALGLREEG